MRLLFLITRAHEGGAQEHVLTLLRGLSGRFEAILATGEHGYLTERAAELGVPVHVLPDLVTPIHPVKDCRAGLQILQLVRTVKPDVVHTHSFKAGLLGRLAALLTATPSMFTAHGWAFADGVPLAQRMLAVPCEWLVSRVTRHIITVSEADHRLALQYRIARRPKMRTVLNGVDPLAVVAPRNGGRVPRIAMVARFQAPKDQSLLLHALRQVEQPYEVWFVGDGSLRQRVEAEAGTLGMLDRVRFLGTCRNVPELLAEADIFVLASRYEGLPMSILEAMRAGLPVVATDVGGVSEAVQDGVTGFLLPRGDCAQLRDRLATLLADAGLRLELGANARLRFEREFSSRIMVEATRSIYEQIALPAQPSGEPRFSRSGAQQKYF